MGVEIGIWRKLARTALMPDKLGALSDSQNRITHRPAIALGVEGFD